MFPITVFGQVTVFSLSLGKLCCEKQPKPSRFDKNSRTMHGICHKLFSMIQSAGIKNRFPQSINRLWRVSLLFISVTCFSDFCKDKDTKDKDTKSFRTGEISFKWLLFWQYCKELYFFPMVELFYKNSQQLLGENFFWKKVLP